MWKNGEKVRKLPIMLALLATLIFSAMLMLTPIARAVEEEDPFSYTPATYSATVMQGGSTSVTVSLGIKTPPTLPPSAFPVTTTGWNPDYPPPSGWTLTDTIQAPKTSYTWNSISDTVSVMLGLTVPSTASPSGYPFTLYLKPGSRADGGSAVGAGTGIAFSITVQLAKVSIMVTSSPATGSGFIKVDGAAYDTPKTFSWTPGTTHALEALSPVAVPTDIQYVWTSWSDGGAQTHTYTVPSTSETVTATYQTQYLVHYATTGNTNPITVPSDEWVNSGSPATGTFPSEVTVDGIKDTFVSDNRPSTITAPTTITATYQTSYLVHYEANVPVTVPSDEWVLSGQPATGIFPAEVISDGTKYVFVSDNRPSTITAPTTITATYDTYYWVQYAANVPVSVPASEWVKSGQPATGVFSSPQYNAAGDTKYVFVSDDRPATITAPTTITATYDTYYLVSFMQTGSVVAPTVDYTAYTDPTGTVPFTVWVKAGTEISYTYQAIVPGATGIRYVLTGVSPASPQTVNGPLTILGTYKTQYFLTVTSPYDTPSPIGEEAWYDAGEIAYAMLDYGLVYVDGSAIGFTGWSGDASGIWLTSDPILMNGPKTATAMWEAASDIATYGDVRTVGFWRHQFTVWYRSTLRIKGTGTAQVSVTDLIAHLKLIRANSGYFNATIPDPNVNSGRDALMYAYNLLAPLKAHTMKEAAEQQLFAVWLNLARKAFFLYTELSQDTLYVYCRYNLWGDTGLQTIAEAIQWSEKQLKDNANLEAAKDVCESINQNLGIIWTAP